MTISEYNTIKAFVEQAPIQIENVYNNGNFAYIFRSPGYYEWSVIYPNLHQGRAIFINEFFKDLCKKFNENKFLPFDL